MKNLKYLLSFAILFAVNSCNKKLDLAPENTLVEKDVFKTEAGAEEALSEAYYTFLNTLSNYFAYSYADFTTPILNKNAYYNTYDLGQATPVDFYVVSTWTAYFDAINSANNVIEKIPLLGEFPDAKKKQFVAEGKFIRAFCYLNLLCLYGDGALSGDMNGLGLPLQLTPFKGYNTGEIIPRSTNSEVYAQIIKDLQESLPDLPDKQSDDMKTRSRATTGSANALLARTYLYMGNYKDAAAAAKIVLDQEPAVYTLNNNLLSLFPPDPDGGPKSFTSEYIFGLPVSQLVSSSTSLTNGLGGTYFYKRSYWINPDFINEFEPGDLRVSQLMWKGDSVYNPNMFNEKATFKFNNSNGRENVPLIRFAEIILTRAEALARLNGVNDESINLLNRIRSRSLPSATPYLSSDFSNGDALVQKILLQRKFELAFEGLHRYDLIRTRQPLHNPDIAENKKVLPIPQAEVDISFNIIKQNSGY